MYSHKFIAIIDILSYLINYFQNFFLNQDKSLKILSILNFYANRIFVQIEIESFFNVVHSYGRIWENDAVFGW